MLVPGKYGVAVSASDLDPTNPHDHVNRFEHRGADRRTGTLSLAITDAVDRFCFPDGGTCKATVRAPRRSAMARLLGGRTAPVRAGFDHERCHASTWCSGADAERYGCRRILNAPSSFFWKIS